MISKSNKLGIALAAISVPFTASAQTTQGCVTRAEAYNLVLFTLPDMINGVRDKCTKLLPTAAYLPRSGAQLASRYKPVSLAAWPKAKPVAMRLAGDMATLLTRMPDDALRALASSFVGGSIGKEMPAENCGPLDRALEAASPLPAENMAKLMVVMIEMQPKAAAAGRSLPKSGLAICSIEPVAPTATTTAK